MSGQSDKKRRALALALLILPLLAFVFSLGIGTYPVSPRAVVWALTHGGASAPPEGVSPAVRDVIFRIRLPRLILGLAVGAALSISGASLQALFKNPLVNEYILGISSGSAVGAALSLVFLGRSFPPQLAAFVFAVIAVGAVLMISGKAETHSISLLLTGIIVTAFFSALLSLIEFFASPYVLQALFFWLMGSLSLASWKDLYISVPLIAIGVVFLVLLRWRFNVLSMSEEEAKSLGVNVRREKILVIAAATLVTSAATAVVGIIGWLLSSPILCV
jgi:iron complex transport system permease protein